MTFSEIFTTAHAAGMAAGSAHKPIPMVVVDGPYAYAPIEAGACGFAWVNISGRGAAAKYAKTIGFRKAYGGGLNLWIHEFGQSMERKEAYAYAYAKVLESHGIKATVGSRMD